MSTKIERSQTKERPWRWWRQPRVLTQLWLEGWEMGEIRDTYGDVEAENKIRDYVARKMGLGPLRFGERKRLRR